MRTFRFAALVTFTTLFLVVLFAPADAQKHGKITKRPKPVEPETQQVLLPQVLTSIIPGGGDSYRSAVQQGVRPNYREPGRYQNPIVHRLEFNDSEAMKQAREWLANPSVAPDRGNAAERPAALAPSGNQFFTGGKLLPTTATNAGAVLQRYPSIPTGMVLEGHAGGLGGIDDVQYDAVLNALVINKAAVNFSPIAPQNLMVLCRTLDLDDRVGVALGDVEITYGQLPQNSHVAIDLKLADNFLGNITFGQTGWLPANYPFATAYEVKQDPTPSAMSVTFTLKDFRFAVERNIVQSSGADFTVLLLPTSKERAPDGGALPDYNAIAAGNGSPEIQSNAAHVASQIAYYRRQPYLDNAFRYGEAAAFLRTLRDDGVDLEELADIIERTTGVGAFAPGPPVQDMHVPIDRLFDAWKRLDVNSYMAQWSPNARQIGDTKVSDYAAISKTRQALFPTLSQPAEVHELIYLGYRDGIGLFLNQYALEYDGADGERHSSGQACEFYNVANEGGRWVIVENDERGACR